MNRIARQLKVTGAVQGVFFRKYTAEKATALQLDGFVRNQPDGSVFIEVEGGDAPVKELISWCNEGSPDAAVDKVIVTEIEPSGHSGFHIRY